MKKLLLITMMIPGFCIAGNDARPRIETVAMMFLVNTMNNPQQLFSVETQPLSNAKRQRHVHQKLKPENGNNQKRCNKQQNAYIHQPRSNNYVAKNRR